VNPLRSTRSVGGVKVVVGDALAQDGHEAHVRPLVVCQMVVVAHRMYMILVKKGVYCKYIWVAVVLTASTFFDESVKLVHLPSHMRQLYELV
jgi:hypothetical protein